MAYIPEQSKCFDCANYCNCKWIMKGIPRTDWVAIPTVLPTHKGKTKDSFLVRECPDFIIDAIRPCETIKEVSKIRRSLFKPKEETQDNEKFKQMAKIKRRQKNGNSQCGKKNITN